MAEYIERGFALDVVKRTSGDYAAAFAEIAHAPAADVAPVRHGRWIFTEYEFFTCSVCGESYYNGAESTAQAESYLNSGHTYKYCPNCGARMDKEDENGTD